ESSVRYLAHDLGARNIRVNAISPGPIATRAASGIAYFDRLLDEAAARAPKKNLATIGDAGALAAFLASDRAAAITGGVHYVDCGYNVMS
ncbi:MAG: SDR family oxidoreductase, partial [Pseudomonadota bacterium]